MYPYNATGFDESGAQLLLFKAKANTFILII